MVKYAHLVPVACKLRIAEPNASLQLLIQATIKSETCRYEILSKLSVLYGLDVWEFRIRARNKKTAGPEEYI